MKTKHTLLGLPKIKLAFAMAMADVPNVEGYRLIGLLRSNGLGMPLVVGKDGSGCHCLFDSRGQRQAPSLFSSWVNDEQAQPLALKVGAL